MAIQEQLDNSNPQDPKVILTISNGDLKALTNIVNTWGFKDHTSVLKFSLGVLSQAQNGIVFIDDINGARIGLKPTEALKRESADGKIS